jgi:hypothetical protein
MSTSRAILVPSGKLNGMLKYSEQFKIVAAVGRKQIIQPINKK